MAQLKILLTLCTLAHVTHSKEEFISVEFDIPNFIGGLLGLNRPLRSIRANALRNGLTLELVSNDDKNNVDDDGMMELRKRGGYDDHDFGHDKDLQTFTPRDIDPSVYNFQSWFTNFFEDIARRMDQIRPYVEMGPGSIKTPIIKYPPKFLEGRLKHLIKMKEKMANETNDNG